ncbi:MAG: helix-turn-helix transcriptional regulator [Clostridia bacterium]|nr:helix-turn-helix transcriptional regulator [Clostridia bacterium]
MSKRIKELRIEQNLKQSELGALLNTTQDSVSLWERGLRAPNIEIIYKMSQIFNVSIDYLFGKE